MSVIFNQPQGLGDIIFCMRIAYNLLDNGHEEVLWPINPIYENIQKHFPRIKFIPIKELNVNFDRPDFYDIKFRGKDYTVIPMLYSNDICETAYYDCMRSKYLLSGMDMETWRGIEWIPDFEACKKIFLMHESDKPLINRYFTTGSKYKSDIKVKGNEMTTLPGYTMFDWAGMIMSATEIHTVGTSLNYLIELLRPKCPIHVYVRKPVEKDFKNYDYIFSKDLDYHFHL